MYFPARLRSLLQNTSRHLALPLAALLLLGAAPAHAQSSTAGAISGTVTDASGALLPGVVIKITQPDSGVTRTVKSNASGEFLVSDLQPSTYTVDITADGFETFENKTVVVQVGSVSSLQPKLKTGSVADKVEVTSENLIMHTEDNAISTTIDQAQIDNLPINGRRWSDFARLTPGVVSNTQGFGLLSFRGISFLLNNNTVDGADDNQAYYSEARGRTRTAYSIPPSAVQEFQVNTSNYSAQYGRAAGGVVNTVTKSGSNNLHGQLFFYDRDNSLGGAVNPYTLLSVPNGNGGYNQVPTKPKDWRKDWGGTVGGAILRDKLFWIYTYDQERRNFPSISRPTDPNDFFAPSNATLPSTETCSKTAFTTSAITYTAEGDYNSCLIAALFNVPFQAGSAYYQQGLGILQSFTGNVPRKQDQVINLPRIDYQINDRNRLTLSYERMRYSSPYGLYSQATTTNAASGYGNDNVKEDFGIARLSTVLSNSVVNDALVQYGRDFEFDYQAPNLPNELPLSKNQFGHAASTQIGYYFSGGLYDGSNSNLNRLADPDERRLQLLDGITWSWGKHTSKFGLEYNKVTDYDNNLYNGNGSFSYDWTYNYIADYLNATTGIGGKAYNYPLSGTPPAYPTTCPGGDGITYCQTYYTYSQGFGSSSINIGTREYAGYATDDWRILPNLTLTLGVRYEYEYVPPSPTPNPLIMGSASPSVPCVGSTTTPPATCIPPAAANTYNRPDDRNNIGPRVGFTWNVYGDGKTILRGGYGMYYGRIINSNIAQTYLEPGSTNGQENISIYLGGCAPQFPAILTTICPYTATAAFFSKHMQNPQVHEADLAIEQNMGKNTTFGITYMMSLGRELPTGYDLNLNRNNFGYYAPVLTPATTAAAVYSYPVSSNSEAPTSLASYPQPAAAGGYVVLPHGGAKQPVLPANYLQKVYYSTTGAAAPRIDSNYYQLLQIQSSINSSYNALAFQVNHRYQHGLSLLTNFTWSHALDENPYESTVVPTFTLTDPSNPRSDYGNSNTDVRMRYVGAMVYEPQTHFHGIEKLVLGGWRISPLVQIQTGLPYSPTISSTVKKVPVIGVGTEYLNSTAGGNSNGSGSSSTRVPWIGRNTYNYPKSAAFDARLSKNFYLPAMHLYGINSEPRLEFLVELFNVVNHQNITGLVTEAYTLGSATTAVPTAQLTPYASFGTYTSSNSNFTYSPRQLQLAARFHF